jgi:hypothetical protein
MPPGKARACLTSHSAVVAASVAGASSSGGWPLRHRHWAQLGIVCQHPTERRSGDVAVQLFQQGAAVRFHPYRRVQTELVDVGTLGLACRLARHRAAQGQDLLPGAWSEGNALGDGRGLPPPQGARFLGAPGRGRVPSPSISLPHCRPPSCTLSDCSGAGKSSIQVTGSSRLPAYTNSDCPAPHFTRLGRQKAGACHRLLTLPCRRSGESD